MFGDFDTTTRQHESRGGHFGVVYHGVGTLNVDLGEAVIRRRHGQVTAHQQVGLTGGNAHRFDVFLVVGHAHVADHRAKLLGQAGLVQRCTTLAFHVGGHGHQRSDSQYTGTADAGNDSAPGLIQVRKGGLRQRIKHRAVAAVAAALLDQLTTVHGDKAGAEALHTAEILVAGALVDLALAAQVGVLGND